MFLVRFPQHVQRKIDLTNAFKNFFRDDSFKPCTNIAGFLGKQRLGCLLERARASPEVLLTLASHRSLEKLKRASLD